MNTPEKCLRSAKIKYLFFDLDGTLTDPYEGITKSVEIALNKFGIFVESRQELKCFIGPPLNECFMQKYNLSESDSFLAVDYFREYFRDTGIFENELFEKIPQLLSDLKNYGYKLVVATSKPTVFAERILEHFDIKKYFTAVYGSELNGMRVKKSDVIKYAIENIRPEDKDGIVMIGDREHDILGAKQSGLISVGVLWGYGSFEELQNAGADYITADVEDLERLLLSKDV